MHRYLPLVVLLPVLFGSCTSREIVQSDDNWPKSLNYAYSPSSENPEARFLYYREIADYLEDAVGVPVYLFETSGYGPVIEAMRSKKVDIASGGSFSYMIAAEKADVEPLVTMGYQNEDGTYQHGLYYSVIAVPADSKYNSVEDLKRDAANVTFSFSDAASTSGHLIPRKGLEDAGITPEKDFRRVVFTQSNLNSAMTIISGKVQAGALQEDSFYRLVEKGKVNESEIKIIWRSKPIPRGPIMVRKELPRKLKEDIRSAFLEMKQRKPELYMKRFSVFSSTYQPGIVYVPAYDYMWNPLRDIAVGLDNMRLIEGKKGLSDWNEEKRQAFLEQQYFGQGHDVASLKQH